MNSGDIGHIQQQEWRWLIIASSALVFLAFAPFLWIAIANPAGEGWQFMGVLHDYRNGAALLAKMQQGSQGQWLTQFHHTPEPHVGAIVQILYTALGQLTRFIGISPIVIFHVARVGASFLMYIALYQLAASIWSHIRTRRLFFVIASLGAGFGWVWFFLTNDANIPDLNMPQMFVFYSTFINIHYPLAIAAVSILAAIMIVALRPGMEESPTLQNGGLMAFLLGIALAFLYPEALVPFGVVLLILSVRMWLKRRRWVTHEWRWSLWILLPPLPIIAYDLLTIITNPAMAEWNSQNVSPAPNPFGLLLAFGIPLIFAAPGIYRAIRRFEPDGDQFMLLWLLAMLVAIYLPGTVQARFGLGLIIPIAYFATRALVDFWLPVMKLRPLIVVALIPIMAGSQLFSLFFPVVPLVVGRPQDARGLLLERDYLAMFEWLDTQIRRDDVVVLTSPNVGIWLPVWTNARAVYGHPVETFDADVKRRAVVHWYQEAANETCLPLLEGQYTFDPDFDYRVNFVLIGPEERLLGSIHCQDDLIPLFGYGRVSIYRP
ncbi:MAG: hypothetical protein D6712_14705 [Chloroflexi bacterium]|nr:MAG: hypothetical protein D6712_14705 [Chloroflexota bacterium]